MKYDPGNVEANWPVPTNDSVVRSFLAIAGYNRKFLTDFSTVVNTLTSLIMKNRVFIWSFECQKSFKCLVFISFISYFGLKVKEFLF